jgi:hypothetical protein
MLVESGNSGKRGVTKVVWKYYAQVNFNIGVERTCGILAQCGLRDFLSRFPAARSSRGSGAGRAGTFAGIDPLCNRLSGCT